MKTLYLALLFFLSLSLPAFAGNSSCPGGLKNDGRIVIYNYHTGETLDIKYKNEKGAYVKGAVDKINNFFRSRSDNKKINIDICLIELLDDVQDHFGANVLELISGYRSPELNRKLKESGANVAEESMHMQGKASDIHIDEVTEEAVSDYVRAKKTGGVGYYPALDFVHIDTGEVRNWDLPDRPGVLLMAFRKGDSFEVTTAKNIYLPKESIQFSVRNITRGTAMLDRPVVLQLFRRGDWHDVRTFDKCVGVHLKSGDVCRDDFIPVAGEEFGKFRLDIKGPQGFPHLDARSNEFYRKKM